MRISDWSSDVCSSDLAVGPDRALRPRREDAVEVPVGHPGRGLLLRLLAADAGAAALCPPGHRRRPGTVAGRRGSVSAVLVVLAAFIPLAPLTSLAPRYAMHGLGRRLHRPHHRRWAGRAPGG